MATEEIKMDVDMLVHEIMANNKIDKYDIQYEGKSEIGDNYTGEILFIKVVTEDGDKIYNYAVKTAKRGKDVSKWMSFEKQYQREVFMYDKVFPKYKELIEETGSDIKLDFLPESYSVSDIPSRETIVMENLKSRGFKLHDKKKPWNLKHSLMVMKSYGKLHALSIALKHHKPEEYKKLTDQMPDVSREFIKNLDNRSVIQPTLKKVLGTLSFNSRSDIVRKFSGFLDEIQDICSKDVEREEEKVISHVDAWNNNFMFQYKDDDESEPISVCLLDFQTSYPRSPVKDLTVNIYTTCDRSSLAYFDDILGTYYKSLTENLQKLGVESEAPFNFEDLKEQWKIYGKNGLVAALYLLKVCFVDTKDIPDVEKLTKESKSLQEFAKGMEIEVRNQEEYMRRAMDVFIHFGRDFL